MIELKVDFCVNGYVTFHIERQDEEDYKRLYNKPFIVKLSDGSEYELKTCAYPAFYREKELKQLFVRGENSGCDYDEITVSISEYLNIFELVQRYNYEELMKKGSINDRVKNC